MELQSTGRSSGFEDASVDCQACTDTVEGYSRIYDSGGVIRGGVISITKLKKLGRTGQGETWLVFFSSTPTRYRESSEAAWQRLKGGRAALRLVLTSRDGSLNVSELYQESL
jgi:hypothetical protein